MDAKHTPIRVGWQQRYDGGILLTEPVIRNRDERTIAVIEGENDGESSEIGQRIVACVNALEGIADPAAFVAGQAALVEAARPFLRLFERMGGEERSADQRVSFKCADVAPFYVALRAALAAVEHGEER